MVICLGKPPRRFLVVAVHFAVVLHFVVVLHLLLFFIHICFSDIIPHPSMDYHRGFTPILYFQPSPSQNDSRYFHFQPFRYLLTASATVLSRCFLPTDVFYPTLLHRHILLNLHLSRPPWEPAVLP